MDKPTRKSARHISFWPNLNPFVKRQKIFVSIFYKPKRNGCIYTRGMLAMDSGKVYIWFFLVECDQVGQGLKQSIAIACEGVFV
mmetsp:Transcript_8464/g.18966  ORF Transcript_8464/g.18966 Transcript_8464/m.18966 type:complete len:84 (+) Transcript_8464:396-647(+)